MGMGSGMLWHNIMCGMFVHGICSVNTIHRLSSVRVVCSSLSSGHVTVGVS